MRLSLSGPTIIDIINYFVISSSAFLNVDERMPEYSADTFGKITKKLEKARQR